jgi:hypothetical protein
VFIVYHHLYSEHTNFYDESSWYINKTMIKVHFSSVNGFSCLLGEIMFDFIFPYRLLMILIMSDYPILLDFNIITKQQNWRLKSSRNASI